MIRGDKLVIGIALVAMISVAAYQALKPGGESRSPQLPIMSSVSALPAGSKAVYLVLEDLGKRPIRWGRSFAQLAGRRGTVITYGSEYAIGAGIDAGEVLAIKDWIAEGNTLLAFGEAATTIFEMPRTMDDESEGVGVGALAGGKYDYCFGTFVKLGEEDKPLIRKENGVYAVERAVGEGKAYLFADSDVVSNAGLGLQENATILTLVGEQEQVFLDDYHRGHVVSGSALEMLPSALRSALLIAILITVLAILKGSFRFGPLDAGEPREIRSGAEIAWSLSRLLQHAGASSTAGREALRAFKTEFGMPHDTPLESVLDRLSGDTNDLRERARALEPMVVARGMDPRRLAELTTLLAEMRQQIRNEARGRLRN